VPDYYLSVPTPHIVIFLDLIEEDGKLLHERRRELGTSRRVVVDQTDGDIGSLLRLMRNAFVLESANPVESPRAQRSEQMLQRDRLFRQLSVARQPRRSTDMLIRMGKIVCGRVARADPSHGALTGLSHLAVTIAVGLHIQVSLFLMLVTAVYVMYL